MKLLLSFLVLIYCNQLYASHSDDKQKLLNLQACIKEQNMGKFYIELTGVNQKWLSKHKQELFNTIQEAKATSIGVSLKDLPHFEREPHSGMKYDEFQSVKQYQETFKYLNHMKEAIESKACQSKWTIGD